MVLGSEVQEISPGEIESLALTGNPPTKKSEAEQHIENAENSLYLLIQTNLKSVSKEAQNALAEYFVKQPDDAAAILYALRSNEATDTAQLIPVGGEADPTGQIPRGKVQSFLKIAIDRFNDKEEIQELQNLLDEDQLITALQALMDLTIPGGNREIVDQIANGVIALGEARQANRLQAQSQTPNPESPNPETLPEQSPVSSTAETPTN